MFWSDAHCLVDGLLDEGSCVATAVFDAAALCALQLGVDLLMGLLMHVKRKNTYRGTTCDACLCLHAAGLLLHDMFGVLSLYAVQQLKTNPWSC